MIEYLFVLLAGIVIGQAYRAIRIRELKRALKSSEGLRRVAYDMNQKLSDEVLRNRITVANIKRFAYRIHIERLERLGAIALLPAPGEQSGQRNAYGRRTH